MTWVCPTCLIECPEPYCDCCSRNLMRTLSESEAVAKKGSWSGPVATGATSDSLSVGARNEPMSAAEPGYAVPLPWYRCNGWIAQAGFDYEHRMRWQFHILGVVVMQTPYIFIGDPTEEDAA